MAAAARRRVAPRVSPENVAAGENRPPIFTTVDGQSLPLENLYRGATAFLLCSGPSAAALDLSLLTRRGAFVLAVNNAASLIRPTAMIFVDKPNKFAFDVWCDPGVTKFCPSGLTREYQLNRKVVGSDDFSPTGLYPADMPNVIAYRREAHFDAASWLTESVINWGNDKKNSERNGRPKVLSVMLAAVKLLYVLGFRRVNLVGCDFKMQQQRPYAFGEGKDAGGVNQNNRIYTTMDRYFRELRPHFDRAGFVVRNCYRESGLRAFDFVEFETAVDEATSGGVGEVIDVMGMYYARWSK